MRNAAWSGLVAVLLAGCVTESSNQSMMLSDDTALISVGGSMRGGRRAIVAAMLTEAAKITSTHRFRYFIVVGTADTSRVYRKTVSGRTVSNQNIPGQSTNYASTNLSNSYIPGATYTFPDRMVEETLPSLDATIRMYRTGEIDPKQDGVWDSDALLSGRLALP